MADLVFILNGPNLNLLGTREPDIYGRTTLAEIQANCRKAAAASDFEIDFRQSNKEGDLVDWVQEAGSSAKGIIINPGAYSHTSIAIRDALQGIGIPAIEVHISNIFARERFRRHSFISPVAAGVICGFGPDGYVLAVDALRKIVSS